MTGLRGSLLAATALLGLSSALDLPANLKSFYDVVSKGKCSNVLSDGFYSSEDSASKYNAVYCGDHLEDWGIVYLQGTNNDLVNMDIDCDGIQGSPADDGRCGKSGDTQSDTSFEDAISGYTNGAVKNLDANAIPYVVFGNVKNNPGDNYKEFKPQEYGVEPLSIMAVVCDGKMVLGVWGDENGSDNAHPVVGEASISLATLCFGKGMNGNNGHGENDVLYIAFTGKDAVPGASANWAATSADQFEQSISELGNKLVAKIGGGSVPPGGTNFPPASTGAPPPASTGAPPPASAAIPPPAVTPIFPPPSGPSQPHTPVVPPPVQTPAGGGGSGSGSGACAWEGHCLGKNSVPFPSLFPLDLVCRNRGKILALCGD
ncbi:fungal chitosanase of glycosyl hydrolase group 75-domain-containing protein [Mariannaea sp. PMI_226]|nr:fungal chitosanase of glycosyl hydrolase group 75-domain-containing protein [Mariannaea sp. PMI_226]